MIAKRSAAVLIFLCVVFLFSAGLAEYSFSNDADAIEKAADSVFMLEVYSAGRQKIAVGSGFLAFDDSTMVTNYHVIEDGSYVIAISDDKAKFAITQACITDKNRDIAILRLDERTGLAPLEIDDQSVLKRSQKVVAIGSPAGLMNTISIGNISAFYQRDGRDWIQFTAPISSGSSGGALLNDQGKVIGITTATYASAQNVNMAVKAKDITALYRRWDGRTTTAIGRSSGGKPVQVQQVTTGSGAKEGTVYITASGKKYHNNPTCSKMRNPIEIDLLDAIERGYEPCGKCYK